MDDGGHDTIHVHVYSVRPGSPSDVTVGGADPVHPRPEPVAFGECRRPARWMPMTRHVTNGGKISHTPHQTVESEVSHRHSRRRRRSRSSAPSLVDLGCRSIPRQLRLIRLGAPGRPALFGAATGTKYWGDRLVLLGRFWHGHWKAHASPTESAGESCDGRSTLSRSKSR